MRVRVEELERNCSEALRAAAPLTCEAFCSSLTKTVTTIAPRKETCSSPDVAMVWSLYYLLKINYSTVLTVKQPVLFTTIKMKSNN